MLLLCSYWAAENRWSATVWYRMGLFGPLRKKKISGSVKLESKSMKSTHDALGGGVESLTRKGIPSRHRLSLIPASLFAYPVRRHCPKFLCQWRRLRCGPFHTAPFLERSPPAVFSADRSALAPAAPNQA